KPWQATHGMNLPFGQQMLQIRAIPRELCNKCMCMETMCMLMDGDHNNNDFWSQTTNTNVVPQQ
ncbi:MAG: hypothetical protein ACKPKO_56870, partial [Candidatus Fonsibacter sp.]